MVDQFTVPLVEGLIFGYSLPLHLLCLNISLAVIINHDRSAPVEGLYRFRPDAVISGEGNMTVISLLTHRHL